MLALSKYPVASRDSKVGAGVIRPRFVEWMEWDPRSFHVERRKSDYEDCTQKIDSTTHAIPNLPQLPKHFLIHNSFLL